MNAKELKAICKQINLMPLPWSQRAYHLTTRLQASGVFFEECGFDTDWRVNVVFEDNKGATVRYDAAAGINRGLKVTLQPTNPNRRI